MCSSGGKVAANDQALQDASLAQTKVGIADTNMTFAENQSVLGAQSAKLNYIAANPMGYSDEQLHTAKTSINENTANAAKHAIGAAASYAASHGGSADIGGGPSGQMVGEIASEAAQSKAQSLSSLSEQNQAMKQKNMWAAISGLQDVGNAYGSAGSTAITGTGSSAGSTIGAGGGVLEAKQAGWNEFSGVLSGISGMAQAGASAYAGYEGAHPG
jgi:hypothetical protein